VAEREPRQTCLGPIPETRQNLSRSRQADPPPGRQHPPRQEAGNHEPEVSRKAETQQAVKFRTPGRKSIGS